MNFARLLDRMIELAFKRQRERQALTFTYETNILSGVSFGGPRAQRRREQSRKAYVRCFHASAHIFVSPATLIARLCFNVNNLFEKIFYFSHVLPFAQDFVAMFGNYLQ